MRYGVLQVLYIMLVPLFSFATALHVLQKWHICRITTRINKRRGLHKMGKGSVQAAIASEGYLSDVEVRLHNMHVHDQIFITKNDEHVEEISMNQ